MTERWRRRCFAVCLRRRPAGRCFSTSLQRTLEPNPSAPDARRHPSSKPPGCIGMAGLPRTSKGFSASQRSSSAEPLEPREELTVNEQTPYIDYDNLPAPSEGFVVTVFITVRSVDRSRAFYSEILGGQVVL